MARPGSSHNFIISALTQVGVIDLWLIWDFIGRLLRNHFKIKFLQDTYNSFNINNNSLFNGIEKWYIVQGFGTHFHLLLFVFDILQQKHIKTRDVSGPQNQTFNIMV